MQVQFKHWNCDIIFGRYSNNRLAIKLVDTEGPVATATINLPDEDLDIDEVIIKDYSENESMLNSLIKASIITEPIRYTRSGHINKIPICKLLVNPTL